MEVPVNLLKKARCWHKNYVVDAIEPRQAKFWFLFWGSIVLSCAIFYVYAFCVGDYLEHLKPAYFTTMVTSGCVLFPALMLRRLHLVGFLFLYYFFMSWLGLQNLTFWLLILLSLIHIKRTRMNHPENNRLG